jgi:hypothetical protein
MVQLLVGKLDTPHLLDGVVHRYIYVVLNGSEVVVSGVSKHKHTVYKDAAINCKDDAVRNQILSQGEYDLGSLGRKKKAIL